MGRRISFRIAQPITIVGFFLASALLIALVSVASSSIFRILPEEEHALAQAFYYANFAAGLYAMIALLMCLTVWGAYKGHYEKEFRLTVSQRTLMLQTIGFMMYLLLGALVFKTVEGWDFLDAVYWADFTLFTVGIGDDFTPKTHTGRSLLFPFAIGGIIMVGLVIGSIRSLVLERGKQKLDARMTEKKRRQALRSLNENSDSIRVGYFRKLDFAQRGLSETQRREQEFHVMREIQDVSERTRKWISLLISVTAAMALWLIGAVVFWKAEKNQGWSYFLSLYFSYTSLLTIGYGDYQPMSNSGKPFFVFWSLLAVPALTILISNMGDTVVKGFSDATIWIGSLTILPDEHGARRSLKEAARQLAGGKARDKINVSSDRPPGFITHKSDAANGNAMPPKPSYSIEDNILDRLTKHLLEEELHEAEEADAHGDALRRDVHFYHFVLTKELRKTMKDTDASPPKQYTYQEWAYYLKLIGHDEADPSEHRKPPIKVHRHHRERKVDQKNDVTDEKPVNVGLTAGMRTETSGEPFSWSWLGPRSPLMGNKSEAQWIVERLSATLEKELFNLRNNKIEDWTPPPISMRTLVKRCSNAAGSGSGSGQSGDSGVNAKGGEEGDAIDREKSMVQK